MPRLLYVCDMYAKICLCNTCPVMYALLHASCMEHACKMHACIMSCSMYATTLYAVCVRPMHAWMDVCLFVCLPVCLFAGIFLGLFRWSFLLGAVILCSYFASCYSVCFLSCFCCSWMGALPSWAIKNGWSLAQFEQAGRGLGERVQRITRPNALVFLVVI